MLFGMNAPSGGNDAYKRQREPEWRFVDPLPGERLKASRSQCIESGLPGLFPHEREGGSNFLSVELIEPDLVQAVRKLPAPPGRVNSKTIDGRDSPAELDPIARKDVRVRELRDVVVNAVPRGRDDLPIRDASPVRRMVIVLVRPAGLHRKRERDAR